MNSRFSWGKDDYGNYAVFDNQFKVADRIITHPIADGLSDIYAEKIADAMNYWEESHEPKD